MKKNLLLVCLSFSLILFLDANNTFAQQKIEPVVKDAKPDTNDKNKNSENAPAKNSLSEFENEILLEINTARQNPLQYAEYLQDIRRYYKDKLFTFPEHVPVLTIEGTTAVDDAVANLKIAKPSGELKFSSLVQRATSDHLQDLVKNNKFTHQGSDGSMPDDRLNRYINVNAVRFGENVVMSRKDARDVVLKMLIDDGVPSRSHRRNLLDPEFNFIGFSSGENNKGSLIIVLIFTTADPPKNPKASDKNKVQSY